MQNEYDIRIKPLPPVPATPIRAGRKRDDGRADLPVVTPHASPRRIARRLV